MKKMWEERYAQKEYAFGVKPNEFLKKELKKTKKGKILFPAEGEGRNAVYASTLGWDVSAFDLSIEGQKKALRLASENKVSIDYQLDELANLVYKEEQFDTVALIFAHFPLTIRTNYFKLLNTYLKKGGLVIIEVFSKNHLKYREKNPKVGGPNTLERLYSIDEIKKYFSNFEILKLEEEEIELSEGLYHNGKGSVIRFIGRKL